MLNGWFKRRLSREAFARGMVRLKSIFAGQLKGERFQLSQDTYDAYYDALADIPDELFLAGVIRILQAYSKISSFPTPGDIRQAIQDLLKEQGERVWMLLKDAISLRGVYVEKFVADKVTMFVLDRFFGGWVGFCNLLVCNEEKDRRLFVEKYAYYMLHPEDVEELPFLTGAASNKSVLVLEEVPRMKEALKSIVARKSKSLAEPEETSQPMSPAELKEKARELKALLSRVGKPMPGEKDAGVHNAN